MSTSPLNVSSIREGPINVVVIDVTQDQKGFEHSLTEDLVRKLADAGIPVLGGTALFPDSLFELKDAIAPEAAIVLLIAHGSEVTESQGSRVARVGIGRDRESWQLLGVSGIDWSDKLVVLCVCWAFNRDMVNAVCESAVDALGVIAPIDELFSFEILQFVPQFMTKLFEKSQDSIDCEDVRSLVTQLEALGDYKMRFLAAGQTLEQIDPTMLRPRNSFRCARLIPFIMTRARRFAIGMRYRRCETLRGAISDLQAQLRGDLTVITARQRIRLRERLEVLHRKWKRKCAPKGTVVRKSRSRD